MTSCLKVCLISGCKLCLRGRDEWSEHAQVFLEAVSSDWHKQELPATAGVGALALADTCGSAFADPSSSVPFGKAFVSPSHPGSPLALSSDSDADDAHVPSPRAANPDVRPPRDARRCTPVATPVTSPTALSRRKSSTFFTSHLRRRGSSGLLSPHPVLGVPQPGRHSELDDARHCTVHVASSALEPCSPRREIAKRMEHLLRDSGAISLMERVPHVEGAVTASPVYVTGRVTSGTAVDGVCTEGNKHIVIGALDVLDAAKSYLPLIAEAEPAAAKVLFLLSMTLQRFEPPEVKEMASAIISNVPFTLGPIPGPGGPRNASVFRDVVEVLAQKTMRASLHWREATVAQVLFLSLAPITSNAAMLESIVTAQVGDALEGRTVIAKVCLCSLCWGSNLRSEHAL
jgi:hypothetical protein